MKDILRVLRSSDAHEASRICDQLNDEDLSAETALSRIRIFAVWVSRSNKRRASWTNICTFVQISTAFIPCDVDTRWNSTYLMLEAALKAKPQITAYLEAQTELPRFTVEDWHRLSQLHRVFYLLYKLTLSVSRKQPHLTMAIPIYYSLHNLLHQGADRRGIFTDIDDDIAAAFHQGLAKYQGKQTSFNSSKELAEVVDQRNSIAAGQVRQRSILSIPSLSSRLVPSHCYHFYPFPGLHCNRSVLPCLVRLDCLWR